MSNPTDEDIILNVLKKIGELPEDEIVEYVKSFEHIQHIDEKYIDKFHDMSKSQRLDIIEKLIEKYYSDEYVNREYSKGYVPRRPLFHTLLEYGRKYGIPDYNFSIQPYFPDETFIIDDNIFVTIIYGQGSIIHVLIKHE